MKTALLAGVLFLTALFPGASMAGGSAVGNGGFGIFKGRHFHLLDLVEAGVAPQRRQLPAELRYSDKLNEIAKYLGVREDLLYGQLDELDKLRPSFGHMLLHVIQFYQWRLSPRIVGRTEDACKNCYQIAVRTLDKVVIDASVWKFMDQENRIALMLHEALFAVMRNDICPRTEGKIACDESHFKNIREIVALVFSSKPFKERRLQLGDFATERLSMGWNIWGGDFRRDLLVQNRPSPERIEKFARKLCSVDRARMAGEDHRFSLIIPFESEDTIYGPQYFLKFLERGSRKVVKAFVADPRCSEKLSKFLMDWFRDHRD